MSFGQLQNLSSLGLGDNQLKELPAWLLALKNLQKLYLHSNKIRKLPKEILDLNLEIEWKYWGSEKAIYVKDNPFETPPVEIVKQGNQAIADYYAALESKPTTTTDTKTQSTTVVDSKPQPLNESKLILIGDGGAGKTSLMKRLLRQEFNPQESQTHGININTLELAHQNQDIKLHCWDFGGQQIMHATHQFFLSKRSLYLLVFDSRRETQPDYWLKHIQTFGNNAPVIIAINKIDENSHFSLPKRKLIQQYPNIKHIAHISCATQDGIDTSKPTSKTYYPTLNYYTRHSLPPGSKSKLRLPNKRHKPISPATNTLLTCVKTMAFNNNPNKTPSSTSCTT